MPYPTLTHSLDESAVQNSVKYTTIKYSSGILGSKQQDIEPYHLDQTTLSESQILSHITAGYGCRLELDLLLYKVYQNIEFQVGNLNHR